LDNQPAVSPPGFSFFSKPSEKHSCFSEGLLKKETMAQSGYFLCGFETWFEEFSFLKPTDSR
jgi:hypothetical protein